MLVGEDDDAGGNESDNEASDDKDDDDVTPQNLKVNGMDDEEEELGKVCEWKGSLLCCACVCACANVCLATLSFLCGHAVCVLTWSS